MIWGKNRRSHCHTPRTNSQTTLVINGSIRTTSGSKLICDRFWNMRMVWHGPTLFLRHLAINLTISTRKSGMICKRSRSTIKSAKNKTEFAFSSSGMAGASGVINAFTSMSNKGTRQNISKASNLSGQILKTFKKAVFTNRSINFRTENNRLKFTSEQINLGLTFEVFEVKNWGVYSN